jgi:WD40 repeat protein
VLVGKPLHYNENINAAEFANESRSIVTIGPTTAHVWSEEDGTELGGPIVFEGIVTNLRVSENGKIAIAYGKDQRLYAWDVVSGENFFRSKDLGSKIVGVEFFGSSGELAFSISDDGKLRLWHLISGRLLANVFSNAASLTSLQVDAESGRISYADASGKIQLRYFPSQRAAEAMSQALGQLLGAFSGHRFSDSGSLFPRESHTDITGVNVVSRDTPPEEREIKEWYFCGQADCKIHPFFGVTLRDFSAVAESAGELEEVFLRDRENRCVLERLANQLSSKTKQDPVVSQIAEHWRQLAEREGRRCDH